MLCRPPRNFHYHIHSTIYYQPDRKSRSCIGKGLNEVSHAAGDSMGSPGHFSGWSVTVGFGALSRLWRVGRSTEWANGTVENSGPFIPGEVSEDPQGVTDSVDSANLYTMFLPDLHSSENFFQVLRIEPRGLRMLSIDYHRACAPPPHNKI